MAPSQSRVLWKRLLSVVSSFLSIRVRVRRDPLETGANCPPENRLWIGRSWYLVGGPKEFSAWKLGARSNMPVLHKAKLQLDVERQFLSMLVLLSKTSGSHTDCQYANEAAGHNHDPTCSPRLVSRLK